MDEDVAYMHDLAAQEREDQLRQLLSYCREEGGVGPHHPTSMAEAEAAGSLEAYADVAGKLAAMLDGEN